MGVQFYMEIKAGNCTMGVWHHYQWHLVVHMTILAGKPVTTWTWTQWETRPCPVVYRYKGEGNSDGQTSCHHWDGLSSVSSEHSLKIKLPARLGLTVNQSKPNTHFQLLAFILETLHHPFEKMLQAWSSSICYIIPLNWLYCFYDLEFIVFLKICDQIN